MRSQNSQPSAIIIQRAEYRNVLLQRLREAQSSIDVEVYIFEWDTWGQAVWNELTHAHSRGVRVRLAIDGFGSRDLHLLSLEDKWHIPFEMRIYNPFPRSTQILFKILSLQLKWMAKKNKRNHKKTFIFDNSHAIVGSRNIFDEALNWIEASVEVAHRDVPFIQKSFEWSWHRSVPIDQDSKKIKSQNRTAELQGFYGRQNRVLINHSRSLKLQQRQILKSVFSEAQTTIRIVTPYFNPPQALLNILKKRSKNGIKVEIFLPRHSDVKVSQALNRSFYPFLIKHGIHVYEVGQTILHAKVTVIDRLAIVGSSNYNYRSFRQDLELDYMTDALNLESLESFFFDFRNKGVRIDELNLLQKIGLRLTRLLTFFIRRTI